jgi:hypothetical protein
MSKRQKELERAVKDVRAGKQTFTEAEIADLKRTVARQRGRRMLKEQLVSGFASVTDYAEPQHKTVPLGRKLPGSFESKK